MDCHDKAEPRSIRLFSGRAGLYCVDKARFAMAISSNISSMFSSGLHSARGVSALYSSQNERVASALRQPAEAVGREIESTRVQLSAFSRVQSAAAEVQSSARQLQKTGEKTSVTEAKKAAQAFVQAYNDQRSALIQTGGTAESGSGKASVGAVGATGNDGRAAVASSQLRRLTSEQAPALREAGIRVERDGSLSVDAKALESAFNTNPKAVTQALGQVGRAAEATATRQLAENGSVNSAMKTLENRVGQLESRQALVESSNATAQRAIESTARHYGFGAVGAGAYLGIFGL